MVFGICWNPKEVGCNIREETNSLGRVRARRERANASFFSSFQQFNAISCSVRAGSKTEESHSLGPVFVVSQLQARAVAGLPRLHSGLFPLNLHLLTSTQNRFQSEASFLAVGLARVYLSPSSFPANVATLQFLECSGPPAPFHLSGFIHSVLRCLHGNSASSKRLPWLLP